MNDNKATMVHIRKATLNDTDSVCELLMILFQQEAEFTPDFEKQKRGVTEVIQHPERGDFLLLEVNHKIVGVVGLQYLISTALGGEVALLEDLIIIPEMRNQGFGKQLLTAAIETAKSRGCLRITLLTDSDNAVGQSLYESAGFQSSPMIPLRLLFT